MRTMVKCILKLSKVCWRSSLSMKFLIVSCMCPYPYDITDLSGLFNKSQAQGSNVNAHNGRQDSPCLKSSRLGGACSLLSSWFLLPCPQSTYIYNIRTPCEIFITCHFTAKVRIQYFFSYSNH